MAGVKRGRKRTRTVNNNLLAEENRAKKIKISHRSHGTKEGQVLSVGQGDTGQLGLGPDIMDRTKPGKVDLPPNVVQVCAGGMHSVCLTADGTVFTWGCNDEGALGRHTDDEDEIMLPGEAVVPGKVVQVTAGDSHSAAVTEDGRVFVWGIFRDPNGKIGLTEEKAMCAAPTQILADHVVCKIASGGDHLVALTDAGDVFTLGCAEQGQLGRVAECFSQRGGRKGLELLLTPAKVHFKKRNLRISDIWTGQYVTYAQERVSGAIYAWGLNNYYQLGFSDMRNRFVPELSGAFAASAGWVEISGGEHHTVALDKNGQVYALGRTEYGRLGLGENADEKAEPTPLPSLKGKKCSTVNAGSSVSFAVSEKGEIFAWGMGTNGQLGQGDDEEDIWEPALMPGKQLETRSGVMVAAGGQHTLLLAADRS